VRPFTVYITLQFVQSLLFSLIFTVNLLYHVTVVQLTPLQLVLIGTTLETTVFLFEIPTGVLADAVSRKLSVVIGYLLIGAGFLAEGSLPFFWTVALAQILWGLGYTFTSGATEAWVADEIGEGRASEAFLRGAQAARIGALVAIPISVLMGVIRIALPILIGGGLMVALSAFLAVAMPEKGFTLTASARSTTWGVMRQTVGQAQQLVRRQPALLTLLGIGLFYGLYSEGFDRLWTVHLLDNFAMPLAEELETVVWFGAIRALAMVLGLIGTEVVRQRLDMRRSTTVRRALMLGAGLLVMALAGFGLTGVFWIALILYWTIGALRSISEPLYAIWLNSRIDDPQVRATMFSISGQTDAVGQILGGPALGAIGNRSVRAALVASALILSPVLALYGAAGRSDCAR
jgi:DHA3 family tetracycline resistance protein-like MFS transporter